ncbi:hypothetical protein ACFXJ8_25330 [Nonomuraea sp. NPDC059194]
MRFAFRIFAVWAGLSQVWAGLSQVAGPESMISPCPALVLAVTGTGR